MLAILLTIFISLFALDVFAEGYGFWETIGAFLIHLLPTFLLVIIILIAWRWEHIGGTFFILIGILYLIMAKNHLSMAFILAGPIFLVGILFLLNRYLR